MDRRKCSRGRRACPAHSSRIWIGSQRGDLGRFGGTFQGSANFDGIAPRRPDDYLYIPDVFHKTFVEIDEKGTEAAAAIAVVMMCAAAMPVPTNPIEVQVGRPFLFAIQHRASGACLFLGRVVNPGL